MKRLLALLLTLLLALPSGFALAEELPAETEDITGVLNGLLDSAKETAEEAVAVKIGDAKDAVADKIGDVKDTVADKIGDMKDTVADKIGDVKDTVADKIGEVTETVSSKAEELIGNLPKKAEELIGNLPEKADGLLKGFLEKVNEGKENAASLINGIKGALPGIWENAKTVVTEKADDAKAFIKDKANQLLDWIKGNKPEDGPAAEPATASSDRLYYFDLFYFGMPVSEAKALGLGDPTVDEENAVQCWTLSYEEPQGFAVVLFSGLDDSAKLTEIISVLYSDADTVTELEEGIDIQTSEETVNAVYDEIESWFTGLQAVELGDHLALPMYPGLRDEEETISRAKLYLLEDGEGYDAATHYVTTTDCGVNVLQYLYVDAAQAEALLTK